MRLIISPTQALLLLIEHALREENHSIPSPVGVTFFSQERSFTSINIESKGRFSPQDNLRLPLNSQTLIKLCVSGARTIEDRKLMLELFQHPLLSEYEVSLKFNVTNDDAVRRFFETKLAEKSLIYGLRHFPMADLESHLYALTKLMGFKDSNFKMADANLKKFLADRFSLIGCDYQALYCAIDDNAFSADDTQQIEFYLDDWIKMRRLWECWTFSYFLSEYENWLPIKIYNEGFFNEANRSRRKRYDFANDEMYSSNVGIFKSTMPTHDYSTIRSKKTISGLVLSEYRQYTSGFWYKHNSKYWVHPFVNSISGTTLVQLRLLAAIKKYLPEGHPLILSKDKLADYFRLFCALLLYGCGGHSWFEFLTPITLREVQEELSYIPGFNKLDMEFILFHNNEEAMRQSIEETIQYNQQILQRARLRCEFNAKVGVMKLVGANKNNQVGLVVHVMKEGEDAYNLWARINFRYTHKFNVNQLDAIYDLFDKIKDITDQGSICYFLNQFFASESVSNHCKESLHHYIQFKLTQQPSQGPSDDKDYSLSKRFK